MTSPARGPASREVDRAARRLADQQTDALAEVPGGRLFPLTVTVASPLTVSWLNAPTVVPYRMASYSAPAVSDRILCLLTGDNQLIALGKII